MKGKKRAKKDKNRKKKNNVVEEKLLPPEPAESEAPSNALEDTAGYVLADILEGYFDDVPLPYLTEKDFAEEESELEQLPVFGEPDAGSEESEETARFIREQVQDALGDTYSEETLREQEARAAQIREERERQEAKEARRLRRERRRAAIRGFISGRGAEPQEPEEAPEEEPAPDNVIQMPVSHMKPIRDTISSLSDKASEMYNNEDEERPDIEPEVVEADAPEPGVEQVSQWQKPRRERRARPAYEPAPDIPPRELARRYSKGLSKMRARVCCLVILCAAMFYLTFSAEGMMPVPDVLFDHPRLMTGILTWCLGLACLLGLDALWMGVTAIRRKRVATHTILFFAILFTFADCFWYLLAGRKGGLPLAAPAALGLLGTLWGVYDRKKALSKTCTAASLNTTPYRVTLDRDKWKGESAFCKEQGTVKGFGSQIQSPDGSLRIYRYFVPLILLTAVVFAILSSVGKSAPERLIWCLSVILIAATPMSGLLAFSQPYLRLTRRLGNSVALAGWDGVLSMDEEGVCVFLRDEDLFPVGSVKVQGVKTFDNVPLEKVTGCAASMIEQSGSGLTKLFTDLVQVQGGFLRRVDDMSLHEAGGIVATIRGEQVMIGTSGFMSVMHIPLKQGEYVKEGIFCAIDGQVQGIFPLRYDQSRTVRPSCEALLSENYKPVLVTRDFNITPAMLHRRFKLPVNKIDYPNVRHRHELSEPGQPHNPVLGALIRRDGLAPYADAIIGARRLIRVVRANTFLALGASLAGMLLTFYLTFITAYLSLSALNMMLFLLLWLVPNLLVSRIVDKF